MSLKYYSKLKSQVKCSEISIGKRSRSTCLRKMSSLISSMSCTEELPIDETLTVMHDRMCREMEASGKLCDYLMDAAEYLKTEDKTGWMARFQPTPTPITPPPKRRRISPNTVIHTPLPLCLQCKSDKVIEDVREGTYVCVACGLIQSRVVSMEAHAHCSWDALKNHQRVYIHRYSKIVYFGTVVRLLQGDSSPEITQGELSRLRVGVAGELTIDNLSRQLRLLGMSKKYRRHRWALLLKLGGVAIYKWDAETQLLMMKMFRKVEYYWRYYRKTVFSHRVTFFSYTTLVYYFLTHLKLQPKPLPSLLLKSLTLREKQRLAYNRMCEYTDFTQISYEQ